MAGDDHGGSWQAGRSRWFGRRGVRSFRVAGTKANKVRKSQIAIQHAHDVRRRNPSTWVLWVHASSLARFKESYQDIAERLHLPGRNDSQQNVLQLVHRWLTNDDNGPWLMVIDNADDRDILYQPTSLSASEQPLASYVPKTGQGCLLVTSRSERAAEMLVGEDSLFSVLVMEIDQSKDLLRARLGEKLYDDSIAADLINALGYLPLAIVQAASFIKRRTRRAETILTYLKKFQKSKETKIGLLALEAPDLRRDESASRAVLTTWQMTFDQVRRERKSAAELLCFMSFFHPQGIPDFILKAFYKKSMDKDLEDDIDVLMGYALVATAEEQQTLEMHALVQLCTQVWLSTFDDQERWRCIYLRVLSSEYPFGSFQNWAICRRLEPHIQRAIERCPTGNDDIRNWILILNNTAWFQYTTGNSRRAERMNREALEANTKVLGEEHPDTLAIMNNLASVLLAQGKYKEAETINRQTLEARIKVLGEEHLDTLMTMSNLVSVLQNQGKHKEAEMMDRQTLEARIKVLGEEHPDTLTTRNNLASVLLAQGKHKEAEIIDRQTLEARIKVLGEEHPDTLTTRNNLALVLWTQGKHKEAETMDRQTLEARIKVLGEEHPDTLTTRNNLALVLWTQGKHKEAETMDRQTLETKKKVLGKEHPETLRTISNLALALQNQGKHREAETIDRQILEARIKVLGEEHPDTLTTRNNLASVLLAQGKRKEAETMDRQTLEARIKVLGEEHPDTLTTMNNLAHTYWSQNRKAAAIQLLEACIRLLERELGPNHPDTKASKSSRERWELDS
ncbi:hypothetical protein VHEMI08099 [[Torrubiella] hemipterigena]|uniref:DUF7779 domain-containing protein n=1 Tax=[Torrubiella] hemipterigena TaxID=1531966 RepID=A0A0A1TMU1_9HYPO|nr:hypothetical protein VHEMI08099 [[Torrubiella] hemipterigena]